MHTCLDLLRQWARPRPPTTTTSFRCRTKCADTFVCYLINAPVASYPIDHVLSPANLLKTSTSVTQGAKKKSVVSKLQKRLRCRVGELVACKLQGGGTLWKELKNVWQCHLSAPTGAPHVKMPREAIAYSSVLAVTGSAVLQ
jgi:hypothetical protein